MTHNGSLGVSVPNDSCASDQLMCKDLQMNNDCKDEQIVPNTPCLVTHPMSCVLFLIGHGLNSTVLMYK